MTAQQQQLDAVDLVRSSARPPLAADARAVLDFFTSHLNSLPVLASDCDACQWERAPRKAASYRQLNRTSVVRESANIGVPTISRRYLYGDIRLKTGRRGCCAVICVCCATQRQALHVLEGDCWQCFHRRALFCPALDLPKS